VRGILAYHLLASPNPNTGAIEPNIRVFSNNFGTVPAFIKTLVNASIGVHPGVLASATFTGPFASGVNIVSYGSVQALGGPTPLPFSNIAAKAIKMDQFGVNGVHHVIDQVLLPANF
jgi:hypothetical protein